ncbi:MAG TPA: hypothetical protein VK484_09125 [Ferruginibacter sp.]|nr:hypothetical protein [Ferruginibacter sp.]
MNDLLNDKSLRFLSGELTIERKFESLKPLTVNISNASKILRISENEAKAYLEKLGNANISETYKARFVSHVEETITSVKSDRNTNYFCTKMPLEFAYKQLKGLTVIKSKNARPFISQEDYELFFKKAFLNDKSIKKLVLNSEGGSKGKITAIFFRFYRAAIENGYEPHKGSAQKYQLLIVDNFEGWTEKQLKGNFKDKNNRS